MHESRQRSSGQPADENAPSSSKRPFEIRSRLRSFKYAFLGISHLLQSQHNARLHALATIVVVVFGFYFRLSAAEWCWIVLSIAFVWTAEAFNTAFELLGDATSKEFDPLVGRAKDVAAAGVLLSAASAFILGVIIFWPHVAALVFHRETSGN